MDDEPMWAANRVVALTPGSAITILETTNEFAIKAEIMLVKVGKFTFPVDFVILEMEEDIGTERMTVHMDSAMKHFYSNDDTCLSIDVIDEILEEDFDALLNEGSKILYSIERTILEEKLFAESNEYMAMTADENSESEFNTKGPPFEKITFNTDYNIKTYLEELSTDLELKPLPDNLEYTFLEEPSFLLVIISSQLSEENKNKFVSVFKRHKQAFAWKTTNIPRIFDIEIKDKKGTKNVAADHLSRIENDETSDDSDVSDQRPPTQIRRDIYPFVLGKLEQEGEDYGGFGVAVTIEVVMVCGCDSRSGGEGSVSGDDDDGVGDEDYVERVTVVSGGEGGVEMACDGWPESGRKLAEKGGTAPEKYEGEEVSDQRPPNQIRRDIYPFVLSKLEQEGEDGGGFGVAVTMEVVLVCGCDSRGGGEGSVGGVAVVTMTTVLEMKMMLRG
ncbi:hypothetical protein Tco_0793751 [Tanacetum coccineum]